MNFDDQKWDTVIEPKQKWFSLNIKQIMEYKDLIFIFVKRDMAITYKQTILGPLWYILEPACTSIMCLIVFRNIAGLSTEGVPPILFYFAGMVLWTLFSKLLLSESKVFSDNQYIFGKVYFPRLTVPIAVFFGELNRLIIQFLLFALLYFVCIMKGYPGAISLKMLLIPAIFVWVSIQACGLGLIISGVTTKYRDLAKALTYLLSLSMYLSPVAYPLSEVSVGMRVFYELNPLTAALECFRKLCFGNGDISPGAIAYSVVCSFVFLLAGVLVFHKNEKSFVDVI